MHPGHPETEHTKAIEPAAQEGFLAGAGLLLAPEAGGHTDEQQWPQIIGGEGKWEQQAGNQGQQTVAHGIPRFMVAATPLGGYR